MSVLKQTLGVMRGTALMLNIVLGAGLLTLPGLAYREIGPDALWIWLACALAAAPLLLVFALVGRVFPADAGGVPALARRQFGHGAYTASTFLFLGAVALGLPGIALTGGYYAASFLDASAYLLVAGLLVLATAVNFLSARLAGRVNGAIASLLIGVLIAVVVLGAYAVSGATMSTAFVAPSMQHPGSTYAAVFMMVFFAFTGWEVAAHLSEEFKNPKRDIPLAMLLSFVIAVSFYLALAAIVSGSGLVDGLEAPFAALFSQEYGAFAGGSMAAIAVLLIFANLSAAIWAVSRMVFSAAREGLLPGALAATRDGVPQRAVAAVLGALLLAITLAGSGVLPLNALLEYAGQNFLIIYGVAAAVLLCAKSGAGSRAVASLALCVVLAILFFREPVAMIYPAALVLLALIASRMTARKRRLREAGQAG
jgi:amino acid efflux transporter